MKKLASLVIVVLAVGALGACRSEQTGGTGAGGQSGAGTTGGNGGSPGGSSGSAGSGGGGGSGGNGGTGGAGGTVSGDAGTIPCGDAAACSADQVCLLTASGAASYVCPDAGHVTFPPNCDGRVVDQYGCCYGAESAAFRCVARPSGCGATVTCACASALCTSNGGSCAVMSASEIGCWQIGP